MLDVVSLFSGIEGFGLGLERTGGFRVVAQVEQDPFCLAVLEQHWPHVPRFTDVREVGAHNLPRADVVTGGFPCQDISYAGAGAGLAGERSGLWTEMLRIVGELRPRYVLVENVSALLARGVDVVLGGLAALGYDAEWDCIPASAVGAPHRRDRIWLVAYPRCGSVQRLRGPGQLAGATSSTGGPGRHEAMHAAGSGGEDLADAAGDGRGPERAARRPLRDGEHRTDEPAQPVGRPRRLDPGEDPWRVEPDVGRVADGVPARVDRLRALGNALVPQIPEWIGHRILEHEGGVNGF